MGKIGKEEKDVMEETNEERTRFYSRNIIINK